MMTNQQRLYRLARRDGFDLYAARELAKVTPNGVPWHSVWWAYMWGPMFQARMQDALKVRQ
ncbi:hypothetical protein LCGC14_2720510 [marine sediment metagenome]|uniref:Uncharacterized protein n=1 Tax=marine sediment metagenome TaxID=412755 RepID=A0A0F9BJC7_9ZZZZ